MTDSNLERILHVAPTPFFADRGCHIRIRGLVLGLESLGISNRVCTYSLGREIDGVDTVRCPSIWGYSDTKAGPSAYKYLLDLLLTFTVARQIWSFKPDVLHCHLHEGVLIGWIAKLFALRPGLRIGFDMQGSLTGELESYGYFKFKGIRWIFKNLEKMITSMATVSFCSSAASARILTETFSVDPERIVIATDGADITQDVERTPAIDPESTPIVVYTGGLMESKGLGMLQDVILKASTQQVNVKFLVIGYPTEKLQQFLESNQLSNCELVGRVPFEKLGSYLRRGALCIEPKSGSTTEASGKLMNYMGAGLPVVCFDTPNNRELLKGHAYFAADPTAEALLTQIKLAIDNPAEASARGLAAAKHAMSCFSWTRSVEKIRDKYDKILF